MAVACFVVSRAFEVGSSFVCCRNCKGVYEEYSGSSCCLCCCSDCVVVGVVRWFVDNVKKGEEGEGNDEVVSVVMSSVRVVL